jgi:hypothetical protein
LGLETLTSNLDFKVYGWGIPLTSNSYYYSLTSHDLGVLAQLFSPFVFVAEKLAHHSAF